MWILGLKGLSAHFITEITRIHKQNNLITFVKLHHMILFSGEVLRGDRIVNTLYEVCPVV